MTLRRATAAVDSLAPAVKSNVYVKDGLICRLHDTKRGKKMKKRFGVLLALALLAVPTFADEPGADKTVEVTVNVSPYAEISGLSEISLDTGNRTFNDSPYDLSSDGNDFHILANFAYDLHVTAEDTFDDGDNESLGAKATIVDGGVEGAEIAYTVRVLYLKPNGWHRFAISQVVNGVAKGIVPWKELQDTGGEAGKTRTLRLRAEITTLTSNSISPAYPHNVGSETDLEAWLAGSYEGELTLTVVEAGK